MAFYDEDTLMLFVAVKVSWDTHIDTLHVVHCAFMCILVVSLCLLIAVVVVVLSDADDYQQYVSLCDWGN